MDNLIKCKRCGEVKNTSEFYVNKCKRSGYNSGCKECDKKTNRRISATEGSKLRRRIRDLNREYGLSLDEYNRMFKEQNGCCAICCKPESDCRVALGVDHDHVTGVIRGLLCKECNTSLGAFKENIEIMLSAINYLREHKDESGE